MDDFGILVQINLASASSAETLLTAQSLLARVRLAGNRVKLSL